MREISLMLVALCLVCTLKAQESNPFNLNFNHMALSVTDLERSASFYKNVLKLKEIPNLTFRETIRWFSLGGDKELHLISDLDEKVIINKAVHLALTTSHFDDFIKSLEDNNVIYSDWPGNPNTINIRADGLKQIFFQDPDGYWIEVNSLGEN